MRLQINKIWYITSDERQYLLQETKTTETGDKIGSTYEHTFGYYGSISSALKAWSDMELRASDADGIDAIMDKINDIASTINKILKVKE